MSTQLQVLYRPTESLLPAHRNPRTHSPKQVRKLADSIARFGLNSPILVAGDPPRIVAGHGRWSAAKQIGLTEVPTVSVDHLAPEEIRAYALADNQLATLAGWDRELLSLEIAELEFHIPGIDLTVTGFEIEQIEILRDVAGSKQVKPEPQPIPVPAGPAVTRAGDLWRIGEHKLLCGDALEGLSYDRLLRGTAAHLVITDPPYNVPIAGHVTGRAHREFAMASGDMSRAEFRRFLSAICGLLARHSRSGSLHYLFMDWRSIADLITAGEEHYVQLLNIIAWVKPAGGMGSLYRSRHELVALFKNGTRPHTNNVALGANGRNRTNVWEYAGINSCGADRGLGALHPTVKNVDMIAEAIRDASNPDELVLDPFGGSGTTLIAAHQTGRHACLIELDPLYCDVCIRRAMAEGLPVSLEDSGHGFVSVGQSRLRNDRGPTGDLS